MHCAIDQIVETLAIVLNDKLTKAEIKNNYKQGNKIIAQLRQTFKATQTMIDQDVDHPLGAETAALFEVIASSIDQIYATPYASAIKCLPSMASDGLKQLLPILYLARVGLIPYCSSLYHQNWLSTYRQLAGRLANAQTIQKNPPTSLGQKEKIRYQILALARDFLPLPYCWNLFQLKQHIEVDSLKWLIDDTTIKLFHPFFHHVKTIKEWCSHIQAALQIFDQENTAPPLKYLKKIISMWSSSEPAPFPCLVSTLVNLSTGKVNFLSLDQYYFRERVKRVMELIDLFNLHFGDIVSEAPKMIDAPAIYGGLSKSEMILNGPDEVFIPN